MISKRLKDHKSSQCQVLFVNNDMIFRSYTTNIIYCEKVEEGWKITCTGTYSQTTRKQIGWFLKEYFPTLSYYDIKEIAGTDKHITV